MRYHFDLVAKKCNVPITELGTLIDESTSAVPQDYVDFGTVIRLDCPSGYAVNINSTGTVTCLADQTFGAVPFCESM